MLVDLKIRGAISAKVACVWPGGLLARVLWDQHTSWACDPIKPLENSVVTSTPGAAAESEV
jgi:hypothetical protein